MKKLFLLAAVCISQLLSAQTSFIPLYDPATPVPGSESWNWPEGYLEKSVWQTPIVYNVTRPALYVYRPEAGKANGTAVVICPGGGFYALSIESEGKMVAASLVKKGITCFVLTYRLVHTTSADPAEEMNRNIGNPEFEQKTRDVIPLSIADGKAAIRYVRSHAAEYNLLSNRIGIMGFSAGGHLAATASTHWPTLAWSESARSRVGKPLASIFKTARSVLESAPTRVAENLRLSYSVTSMVSAKSTTWLLVMI